VVSSAPSSAFDDRDGWSREVLSAEPYLAVHRRVAVGVAPTTGGTPT
jgi:hypothetical protein